MAALIPAITTLAGIASAGRAVKSTKKPRQRAKRSTVVITDMSSGRRLPALRARARRPVRRRKSMKMGTGPRPLTFSSTTALQVAGTMGRQFFSPVGPADANADVSNEGSLKLRGYGLLGSNTSTRLSSSQLSTSTTVPGLLRDTSDPNHALALIGPNELDSRLGVLASCWSFFAIRKLRICYVPGVSQYNYGTYYVGNVGFGLLETVDYSNALLTSPSLTAVNEMPAAAFGALYSPAELQYRHNGSRVWNCSSAGTGDAGEEFQLALYATIGAGGVALSSGAVGNLWAEWEIDLYRPSPVETQVSLPRLEKKDQKSPLETGNSSVVKDEKDSSSAPAAAAAAPSQMLPMVRAGSTDSHMYVKVPSTARAAHFAPPAK